MISYFKKKKEGRKEGTKEGRKEGRKEGKKEKRKEKKNLKKLIPAFIWVALDYFKICETFKKILYINA